MRRLSRPDQVSKLALVALCSSLPACPGNPSHWNELCFLMDARVKLAPDESGINAIPAAHRRIWQTGRPHNLQRGLQAAAKYR